jgi:2-oxoglutarate ferredoxin oxidoreductase subunit delta
MAEVDAALARSHATPSKEPPEIEIKVSWCKGCGLCVDYCARGVLEMREALPIVVNAERCSRCMLCEAICPDFAITVVEKERPGHRGGGTR